MWIGVLGPTAVRDGNGPVALPAAKHRALIAALALRAGRPVAPEVLVAALWGAAAPPSANGSLHSYLSVVRRTLEPALTARAPSSWVASSDLGYQLLVDPADVDAEVFARTVHEVHEQLGPLATEPVPTVAAHVPDPRGLRARLDEALALWRGEPYADIVGDLAGPERARLGELRLLALEDRATLLVATGAREAVGELEAITAEHPLRERPWVLLAVALARAGRQADALAALERLRTLLAEEIGIDPSPAWREVQTAILRQALDEPVRVPAPRAVADRDDQPRVPLPDWPLVGRDDDLATLLGLLGRLDRADGGRPVFAVVEGEPGAGKSRLALELGREAHRRGHRVLVGRCSQDEDAPPLWPWTSALGREVGAGSSGDHDVERFRLAEEIRRELAGLSRDRGVLLVLEDLQWADASSLRVLRHLCGHADAGRLLVVCTWRTGSAAAAGSALGEAAEALARTHATHLGLSGLPEEAAAGVLAAITGSAVEPEVAAAARARTGGNPFFLIEYARLARDRAQPLVDVLDSTPRTVADVVQRRIRQLPADSAAAVTAGAVIGREFDLGLLASALGVDELAALDLLEPALEIDLVQDLGADRFRFGHALVRDTAYAELSPSRRERMHARLAELVSAAPRARSTRASEIARHWAAAGERHVDRAWRAAAHAGDVALAAHAPEEAARHYAAALDLAGRAADATDRDRLDLHLGRAQACRWSTRLVEMTEAVDQAIRIGADLGEPALVVRATAIVSAGSIWPWRRYGEVSRPVVAALRTALAGVGTDDTEVRCRLLMGLAREQYYTLEWHEVDALVEEAVAMARRLGDPALLVEMLQAAYSAVWRRATTDVRRRWAEESVALATEHGLRREAVVGRFLQACIDCEVGAVDGLDDELARIAADARAERLSFVEMATVALSCSWAVLRDDVAAFERGAARLKELDDLISLSNKADAIQGALIYPTLWNDAPPDLGQAGAFIEASNVPVEASLVLLLLRKGLLEEARATWAMAGHEPAVGDWYAEANQAMLAEIALGLGDHDLGARVYRLLLPTRSGMDISGSSPVVCPGDAALAVAAAAAGEHDVAREHADRALEQCAAWRLTAVARWLSRLRDRHGF